MFRFRKVLIPLLFLVPTSGLAVTAGVEDVKSIARLYSAAFDRVPESDGLNFWVKSYQAGRTLVSIAGDFYKSPEFTNKYGLLSDQQYVEQLYENVLGRPGEDGGVNFWTNHLANGVSRARILAEFADSPENISKTYETFADMRLIGDQWVFEPVGEPSTMLVKDISPGTKSSGPWFLIDFKNKLYFTANEDGMAALWRSDGTGEGTLVFKKFTQAPLGGASDPGAFVVSGNKMFFRGIDYEHGTELWVSDGTSEGTVITKDIWPGTGMGLYSWPYPWKDGVLFIADDGISGKQIWISDGTTAGTRRYEDAAVSVAANAKNFYTFNNGWLFSASDPAHGAEVWRSDGTEGGSELVMDIVPGPVGSFPSGSFTFADLNGIGIFWVWNENRIELWRTDGTAEATSMFWNLSDPDVQPYYRFISDGEKLIFFLEKTNNEWDMWCTDGTEEGTELLKAGFIDEPADYIEYKGLLYLSLMTADRETGYELWRTDGTTAGTQIAFEIYPGPSSAVPQDFTLYDGLLYFTATDGIQGEELYRTNGTAEGTELVEDIAVGSDSSSPNQLTVSNGALFFDAWDPYYGRELYKTVNVP